MKLRDSTAITVLVTALGASFIAAVVLLAVGFFSSAFGQNPPPTNVNPCTGLPAAPPYYIDIDLAKPWPVCSNPSVPRLDANDKGIVGWRWCRATTGRHWPQWAVVPWSDFMAQPALALELTAAGLSLSDDAMKTITGKYAAMIKPLAHPDNAAIWCPLWTKIAATRPADIPPPSAYTWIVAKNSTSALRPTYLVVNGRRSTASNGSVPVGADCDVTRTVVEGALTFGYPPAAKPDSVALCVRR